MDIVFLASQRNLILMFRHLRVKKKLQSVGFAIKTATQILILRIMVEIQTIFVEFAKINKLILRTKTITSSPSVQRIMQFISSILRRN